MFRHSGVAPVPSADPTTGRGLGTVSLSLASNAIASPRDGISHVFEVTVCWNPSDAALFGYLAFDRGQASVTDLAALGAIAGRCGNSSEFFASYLLRAGVVESVALA